MNFLLESVKDIIGVSGSYKVGFDDISLFPYLSLGLAIRKHTLNGNLPFLWLNFEYPSHLRPSKDVNQLKAICLPQPSFLQNVQVLILIHIVVNSRKRHP